AAYGPGRSRAAHPAYAPDGSLEPGPRAGIYRTTAPDRLPTDPSSPDPIAIDSTATESRLRQARNTPFSTAPAMNRPRRSLVTVPDGDLGAAAGRFHRLTSPSAWRVSVCVRHA